MIFRYILFILIGYCVGHCDHLCAMQSTVDKDKARQIGLAQMGVEGWCPGMARVPLKQSTERAIPSYCCIPSSPARCDGACCMPVNNVPNLGSGSMQELRDEETLQDAKDQQDAVSQLRDALKLVLQTETFKKVFKSVGKSEAKKILDKAIEESSDSSDSDTDSSASIGSPHTSIEEELMELLEKKAASKSGRTKSL